MLKILLLKKRTSSSISPYNKYRSGSKKIMQKFFIDIKLTTGNLAKPLQYLQIHLYRINTCILKSKISINENKSKHVTFTTRR